MDSLVLWGLTTVAAAVGGCLLYYVTRIDKKLDDLSSDIARANERLTNVEKFIANELRLMDVRLTRVETHLGLK